MDLRAWAGFHTKHNWGGGECWALSLRIPFGWCWRLNVWEQKAHVQGVSVFSHLWELSRGLGGSYGSSSVVISTGTASSVRRSQKSYSPWALELSIVISILVFGWYSWCNALSTGWGHGLWRHHPRRVCTEIDGMLVLVKAAGWAGTCCSFCSQGFSSSGFPRGNIPTPPG